MSDKFLCYHTTMDDRLESILENGLVPGSESVWWEEPVPYIMLSDGPWWDLNGEDGVTLEVSDPAIKAEYFDEPEGLRWPYVIKPYYLKVLEVAECPLTP